MRNRIIATIIVVGLGVFGFTTAAEAATVRVRCNASALVAAITTANAAPGTVLSLARGCVYKLHSAASPGDGLPQLTSTTTIIGHGATIVRKSSTQFRILDVGGGANVTISSLTIKNGHAMDGFFGAFGGGILNAGTLVLNRVKVVKNRAGNSTAAGIPFPGGGGGGISNTGTLTMSRSKVLANRAGAGTPQPFPGTGGDAGGILDGGTMHLSRTTIARNRTGRGGTSEPGGSGGGINLGIVAAGTTISHSVITRNKAVAGGQGGGIFNGSFGPITPTNTKIVRNRPNNCAGPSPVTPCRH